MPDAQARPGPSLQHCASCPAPSQSPSPAPSSFSRSFGFLHLTCVATFSAVFSYALVGAKDHAGQRELCIARSDAALQVLGDALDAISSYGMLAAGAGLWLLYAAPHRLRCGETTAVNSHVVAWAH